MALLQLFLLIKQDVTLQLIVVGQCSTTFTGIEVKVQRICKQVKMELYLRYKGFYSMAVYCDFNEINGGKLYHIYHLPGMSTNSYFHN